MPGLCPGRRGARARLPPSKSETHPMRGRQSQLVPTSIGGMSDALTTALQPLRAAIPQAATCTHGASAA